VDVETRAVYEARAGDWAELRPPGLVREAAAFSQRCLRGLPIVDLGCGPGSYFASLGRPLVGLDNARAMLHLGRAARSAPGVAVVQGDLAQLPFRARCLGGAWARASYLHLRRHDLPVALAQLHRALMVGAPLEMTLRAGTGEGPLPGDDFPGRFFAHWAADELAAVVVGAGFVLDSVDVTGKEGDWLTVRARAGRTLPDFVGPGLRVLVCGLNPSVVAADAGFGYAGATNRFWRAAMGSGLVAAGNARDPLRVLAGDRVGMTDLVKRATPRASELTTAEYRAGLERVARMSAWLRPGVVLFVGLAGWRAAADRGAHAGVQPAHPLPVPVYVMPSTSGLNAATSLDELIDHMRAALAVADAPA
jgi:TDG/mug DNA glycosylase family protein